MESQKNNPMVDFYEMHNISPVHQNISDIRTHFIRRENLYRTLGLPPVVFSNKSVLEVGPGSGYNALAFFYWGASVDLVEPNSKGKEEIAKLLKDFDISDNLWNLYGSKIEECQLEKQYDIVIAEGFITEVHNKAEVASKLACLAKKGGVVVVTCLDEISILFEQVKRLLGWKITEDIENFNEKVTVLCSAFATHLSSLKFCTRPLQDWVIDEFINPSIYTDTFSIIDCIKQFGEDFEYLGGSPSIFTDYSWYKDMFVNRKESVINQFYRKRHLLIMTELEESFREIEENHLLYNTACNIHKMARELENKTGSCSLEQVALEMKDIGEMCKNIDIRITGALNEAITLLMDDNLTAEKISNAQKIAVAFGRAQQYVSLVKKYTV